MEDIRNKSFATAANSDDTVLGIFGNTLKQMTFATLRNQLNSNQEQYLNEVAFYIEVNNPASAAGEVNTGGSELMLALWTDAWVAAVMDKNGNYTELSHSDNRYTEDGIAVLGDNGTVASGFAECNFMGIIPATHCFLQTVTVNGSTFNRLWLSLTELPGGWVEQRQVVGLFKSSIDSAGRQRSLPGVVTADSKSNYAFWSAAQLYGKDWGNAGSVFRSMLLWYMMAKYKQRSSQTCLADDGSPVWGVGLDGTEGTGGFENQKNIKTGATLVLGNNDGKVEVTDAGGGTCHQIKVKVFEGVWGQKWEMDGHDCSVGDTVYHWDSNFMPSVSSPTADTFAGIDTVTFQRLTNNIGGGSSGPFGMVEITTTGKQRCIMLPSTYNTKFNYGDGYWYASSGQLWIVGGASVTAASCGLACANSIYVWTYSSSYISARLDYHGSISKVTGKKLLELAAA